MVKDGCTRHPTMNQLDVVVRTKARALEKKAMGEIAIIKDIQKDFTDVPIIEVADEELDITKDPEELHYVSPKKRLLTTTRREIVSREGSPDKR